MSEHASLLLAKDLRQEGRERPESSPEAAQRRREEVVVAAPDEGDWVDVLLSFRGTRYRVPADPDAPLGDVLSFVADVVPQVVNARFVSKGKQLNGGMLVSEGRAQAGPGGSPRRPERRGGLRGCISSF